ncbi:MAG: Tol-Pal system protein TolB [Helicobacteraceae bacterium]|jgi:TolB protein|nr:Tol-Pal system protein TolB [Helicobacteraceae bacterium]
MRLFLACLFLSIGLFAADATITITKTVPTPFNIVVESKTGGASQIDKVVGNSIRVDLTTAGFFNVLNSPEGSSASLPFDSQIYQKAGLHYILRYELSIKDTQLRMQAQVYDVKAKKILFSTKDPYTVTNANNRHVFLAHHLIMDLADKMGIGGLDWMNRYVILARQTGKKETEIMIADYTLQFRQRIVRGGFNVFPKWADSKQTTFYYTHYEKKPTLYKVELKTGIKTKILDSEGMLVCSDVSKDGRKLLLTMADNDQPDIYEYDTITRKKTRLTNFRGIDVNGRYLENDASFVFVTDRLGYPEIFYAKIANPENAEQFIFKGRNNNYITTCGDRAVFVSRDTASAFENNTFNLYLVSTKSNYMRQLTATGKNNFPRFSRTCDTILHTKEIKRNKEGALAVIRLDYNKAPFMPTLEGSIQSFDW